MSQWQNRIVGYGMVKVADVLANPFNFRIHNKRQQDALSGSLETLGVIDVIKINVNTQHLVDGHLRVTMALRNNEPELPAIFLDLTQAEEAQALLSLDPIAAMAASDASKVDELLRMVNTDNEKVMQHLADFAAENKLDWGLPEQSDAEPQIDRAAELLEKWKVTTGSLWQIGEHRLICGDCTDAAVVEKVMGNDLAQMAFTSPPYAEQRKEQYGGTSPDKYVEWWKPIQNNVRLYLKPDGSFFVNIKAHRDNGSRHLYVMDLVCDMVRVNGWRFVDELCWNKNGLPGDFVETFRNDFEPIYHFAPSENRVKFRVENVLKGGAQKMEFIPGVLSKRQGTGNYKTREVDIDGVRPSNVLRIGVDTMTAGHAAAFPVSLPLFFILSYSDESDIILEPFNGSGTTLVACQNTNRIGRAIDISPEYIALTLERMSNAFPHLEIRRIE